MRGARFQGNAFLRAQILTKYMFVVKLSFNTNMIFSKNKSFILYLNKKKNFYKKKRNIFIIKIKITNELINF